MYVTGKPTFTPPDVVTVGVNSSANSNHKQKVNKKQKTGRLNEHLAVEASTQWKSRLKTEEKLPEISTNMHFDSSAQECLPSTSSQNSIKLDKVSRHIHKTAEKPKVQTFRNDGSQKKASRKSNDHAVKEQKRICDLSESEAAVWLDKVAAQIGKIWDDRFGQESAASFSSSKPESPHDNECNSNTDSTEAKGDVSHLSQKKNMQKHHALDRKKTKNYVHKAKLQAKKHNVKKLKQQESNPLLNEHLQLCNSKSISCSSKQSDVYTLSCLDQSANLFESNKSQFSNIEDPVSSTSDANAIATPGSVTAPGLADPVDIEPSLKSTSEEVAVSTAISSIKVPPPEMCVPASQACCVCGLTIVSALQKYRGQLVCNVCSEFFENFIETPKQYFCLKEGNCKSNVKDTVNKTISKLRYRCKACWLKMCMKNFSVPSVLKNKLLKYVPRHDAPPHKPLIDDIDMP